MNDYGFLAVSPAVRRAAGDLRPRDYNPQQRIEGGMIPEVDLVRFGARFESSVAVKHYEVGEPIVSKTGQLAIVKTPTKNVLVLDTGQGEQSYAPLATTLTVAEIEQATSQAISETAPAGQAPAVVEGATTVPLPSAEEDSWYPVEAQPVVNSPTQSPSAVNVGGTSVVTAPTAGWGYTTPGYFNYVGGFVQPTGLGQFGTGPSGEQVYVAPDYPTDYLPAPGPVYGDDYIEFLLMQG